MGETETIVRRAIDKWCESELAEFPAHGVGKL